MSNTGSPDGSDRRLSSPSSPNGRIVALSDWRSVRLVQLIVFLCNSAYVMEMYFSYQYTYHRLLQKALPLNATLSAENSSILHLTGGLNPTQATREYVSCTQDRSSLLYDVIEQAQAEAAILQLCLSLSLGIPTICAVLLLGTRSDTIGRKIVLTVGNFGLVLFSVGYLTVTYMELNLNYLIAVHFITGLTGSLPAVSMASYAYTSDLTDEDNNRTWSLVRLQAGTVMSIGMSVLLVGAMIQSLGYVWPNTVALGLAFLSLMLCTFLQEDLTAFESERNLNILDNIKRLVRLFTSNKNGYGRASYLACLTIILLTTTTFTGMPGVETLFQLNSPLCWNALQTGIFFLVRDICRAIFGALIIWALLRWLSDTSVALVVGVIWIAALIVEGCAQSSAMVYAAAVLGLTGIYIFGITKAIASKITPRSQYGTVFAGLASAQTGAHVLGPTFYNAIYDGLLRLHPGAVFFVIAAVTVIILALFIFLHLLLRRKSVDDEKMSILSTESQADNPAKGD